MDALEPSINARSLLSLSIAAANANPIPTVATPEAEQECEQQGGMQQDADTSPWSTSLPNVGTSGSLSATKPSFQLHKHRRMSSLGQPRRRTSDARESATRPSPAAVHTAASTLASLATPSLSPSKSANHLRKEGEPEIFNSETNARLEGMGVSVSLPKDGKRGAIFKCETCSKVYRHPSCLVKHRWEHSPHWRETSNFLLSKHQQVQLLEAAAILSHLGPSTRGGASLPEDRALWPAYLSGGKLYPTTSTATTPINAALTTGRSPLSMSSSLPDSPRINRPFHSPPRVHVYAVTPTSGFKHVRPGMLGVYRGDLSDTISRTTSSPVDLRSAKNIDGISSRSKSEGGEHAWNPHSPSVASRPPYSPPTEDDSDFEMDDQFTPNRTFNHLEGNKGGTGEEASEWDGLEMEMEM